MRFWQKVLLLLTVFLLMIICLFLFYLHKLESPLNRASRADPSFDFQHPYPTEDEKKQIAAQTNLTLLQVNNW